MIEKLLSVQDVLAIGGIIFIFIKLFQFYKEDKLNLTILDSLKNKQ